MGAVYAFITTLVLVLLVSAAIISRSYVIRRRRRLFIEEAIRNGTLTGPSPHARFDPNNKPRLWESHLGAADAQGPAWKVETPAEWETIKPLSVTFSVEQQKESGKKARESVVPTAGGGDSLVDELMRDTNPDMSPRLQRWRRYGWTILVGRQRGAVRLDPVLPLTQIGVRNPPSDPSNAAAISSPPRSAERKASSSSSDDGVVDVVPSDAPRPAKITVSLLVAMPSQHQSKSMTDGEEKPLPLLEIGVASVDLDVSEEDERLVEAGRQTRPTTWIPSSVIPPSN